ncbi:Immunoglobulin-like fold [Phytophthora cactorum]|nr:Immunoglobulin-like fold [Phytophthora cactorum]
MSFVPAKQDVADLAELADLEKVSVLTYNMLSQMVLAVRQEVDEYDDWWAAELAIAGYDSIYATSATPDSTTVAKDIDDGLVTAFRKSTFQLFRSTELHLNDLCANINDANLAARAKQDKLALLVCLQPWETSALPSALCVVNTQLAAGATPELERVRVLQTEYLCRQLTVFNADFQLPIAGDDLFLRRLLLQDARLSTIRRLHLYEYHGNHPSNCVSQASGFLYELPVPDGAAQSFIVTSLSASMTYQFRVMARNEYGWGDWSQPSAPGSTLEHAAYKKRGRASRRQAVRYFLWSGHTPRYASDAKPIVNPIACPRPLLSSVDKAIGGSDHRAEAKRYTTLQPRADRDSLIVHSEMMETRAHVLQRELPGDNRLYLPLTGQLTPFQLLELPTLEELEATGQDIREPASVEDTEWVKHKPEDWAEDANASTCYMGTWCAPMLPNIFGRASGWLPNAHCPSDHLPLACVFAVRKQNLAVTWN